MNNNAKIAIICIIVLLLLAILIYSLFFRSKPPASPPPGVQRPVPKVVVPKVEKKLPDFIEKTENYPTGELKCRYWVYRVKPTVKHKTYTEFYKTPDKKKYECEYIDNILDGPVTYWYENSQKAMVGNLKKGQRNGDFEEWHVNGKIKLKASYMDGVLNGSYIEYYDRKDVAMIEKNYVNGKISGKMIYRKADGSVKFEKDFAPASGKEPPAETPAK